MDDDGLPEPDCLEVLLRYDGLDFWGPVVVDEADPDRLVFPIRLPGGTRVVHRMADGRAAAQDGLIRDVVIPFNGVLVTRELVERIGLPREEFFIWGDDHEYRLRAERAGGRVATVVGAAVHHPSVGDLGTPMMFGRTTYNHSPSDLKALLHGPQQPGQPARVPRLAARAGVRRQDGVVLHVHPPRPRPAAAEPRGDARRAPRRLHRPREVPRDEPRPSRSSSSPSTAPTCSPGCSTGWPRQTRTGRTRSSSSTTPAPTTPARCSRLARSSATSRCTLTHSDDNLGGAGGFQPRRPAGVRRGLRPDLAGRRRRGPGARLPRGADGRGRGLPGGRPRGH